VLEVKSAGNGLKFDFVTRINAYSLGSHVENGYLQTSIQSRTRTPQEKKSKANLRLGSVVSFQLKGDE